MTQAALILRNDATLGVSVSAEAAKLKEDALAVAGIIARVSCAEEQLAAVEAQKKLVALRRLTEESRKQAKEPVLLYGRRIDDLAKKFMDELSTEELRITKLIADFQALEMAKVRAAQAAENERLEQLERERQKALAEAKSHQQMEAVQEEFNQKAAEAVVAPIVPARVEGQIIAEIWEFEITDVWALAKAHPDCVKAPEVYRSKVKALLDANIKPVGVKAWRAVKASVGRS